MTTLTRREFVKTSMLASASLAAAAQFGSAAVEAGSVPGKIKLGYDNFAIRAMKWKAAQLIEYAAEQKVDSLFITDFDAFESMETPALKKLKELADDKGVQIHLGTWSICPTSKTFKNKWGTAEEHLALGIRAAKDLGSPVIRVVLGSADDRKTPGGIQQRIEDTVKVCKSQRNRCLDSGVKIAVENHAGDMHSRELVTLIEAAGKDYVGVNLDSGNACWTLEDPLASLENLGRYALTTSLRDSMVWESAAGAKVQWTAMGEGCVDLKAYFRRFAELCPGVPVHIETISGFAREFPYLKPGFWDAYSGFQASDFSRFVALAKRGKAIESHSSPNEAAEQAYQKGELERSLAYCRGTLGLGVKTV